MTIPSGFSITRGDSVPFLARIRAITREKHVATWPALWTWRMPVRRAPLGMLGCPVYFFTPNRIEECHERAGFSLRKLDRVGEIHCTLAEPRR